MASQRAKFTHATATGTLLFDLPEDIIVTRVSVYVKEAWGAGATATVGVNGDFDRYIGTAALDLTTIGVYSGSSGWYQEDSKQVRVDASHNSSTTGEAYVVIEYEDVESL